MADLQTWFVQQYEREYWLRWQKTQCRSTRELWGPTYWRLDANISVWTCLPEEPPTEWSQKPTAATVVEKAREAWLRADQAKAEALRDQWTHQCIDPYYCRMHGFGSD